MSDLISLKCTECSGSLTGENNSRVFFCRLCSSSYYVYQNSLRRFPLHYIEPAAQNLTQQKTVYFPFWQIESQYKVQSKESDWGYSGAGIFYIPAFFIRNIDYFGDIGYYYMQKKVILKPGKPQDLPILPADRGLKTAAKYPLIYLYKAETLRRKGEGLDINVKHKDFSVILIPFYKTGFDYVDAVLSWKYPPGALV
ncbi:MAG: hypothetical protein KAW12_17415 [Candidatus Aminicenantes bacterium]|nr:hypothetical protein [Candidatus Aminicenantes bacterium]